MKKVIILGGSGAGMIAASVAERLPNIEVKGFLNDKIEAGGFIGDYKKFPVLGGTSSVESFLHDKDIYFFCAYEGISNPWKSYEAWKNLPIPRERFINLFDVNSCVPDGYVKMGNGILVAPFSQISPDAIISDNVMMLANSFVGHNSYVGEFSHITSNSVIGAFVHIGKGVTVGMNSCIRGRVHIGDFSLIGAGSMVLNDVPPNSIVAGNPARVIRERGELGYLKKAIRSVEYSDELKED